MTLLGIAIKNVRRNVFRASLTVLGVAVAMLAFVLLRTVLWSWTAGAEYAAQDRITTRHKITFIMSLPLRYVADVRGVPGVIAATHCNWFGGRLPGREQEFFQNIAVDPESFLQVYDELEVPGEQVEAWKQDRQGALVGAQLARKFGWKVGDKVTLAGTIFPGNWEFVIDGIYTSKRKSADQSTFWFHWKYINESPTLAQRSRDQIGWIVSKIGSAGESARISKTIDAMFDVRDTQTVSMSERAFQASFLGMLSTLLKAIDLVSFVILVIMMLLLGNTIAMTVRERTREYGVLRAIGFRPHHLAGLVIGEATAIGMLGAALGVAIAYPLINSGIGVFMEDNFASFFPYFRLVESEALLGLAVAAGSAALAAALPAYSVAKLDVIDALRRVA